FRHQGFETFTKNIDTSTEPDRRCRYSKPAFFEEEPHMSDPPTRPRPSRTRLLIGTLCAALLAMATAFLPGAASAATQICSNQTGTNGGYYYQMWSNGTGSACMTLNSGNSYSTSWSGIGDFVAGVGWNPGSSATVSFNGSMSASGGTSLMSV